MKFFKLVERWFAVICVAATLLGLFVPQSGSFMKDLATVFLAGILFFTGLKLDFRAAVGHVARPWLVIYAAIVLMVVFPLGIYGLARLTLPNKDLACGVLIVAAMPAGLAGSSLTDIARGNTALALVVTMLTSLICPVVTPWMIRLCTGLSAGEGWSFMGKQALFLALVLFTPLGAAYLVRRLFSGTVRRFREACTGLSMISLALLILAAMSGSSKEFMRMIKDHPGHAAILTGFMFGFSAILHVAGYLIAPWRPVADRAALSVNSAYVNNGLAIVFSRKFFLPIIGAPALLPAILLEVPMVLAIRVLKSWVQRRGDRPEETAPADDSETPSGAT